MTSPLKTPVAIVAFNRPAHVRAVLEALSEIRPRSLFAIVDGPRRNRDGDAAKCLEVQQVFDHIDWPCEVHKNFAVSNLGCKMRVVTGLDWVFDNVDEAIILEDDCVPAGSFFRFASELLETYRNDNRIGMIAGSNIAGTPASDGSSYFFARVASCWGWATWARAWKNFDATMTPWPRFRAEGRLSEVFPKRIKFAYWDRLLEGTFQERIDTWDYIWAFTLWLAGQLTVIPSSNMVTNIGFGDNSTHTTRSSHPAARRPFESVTFPLRHPTCFLPDQYVENRIHEISHGSDMSILVRGWKASLRWRLKRLLGPPKGQQTPRCMDATPQAPTL